MSDIRNNFGIFPFVLGVFALWFVAKLVKDRMTSFDDDAEMSRGNVAAMMARVGYYVGIALAASGSLIGASQDYWSDFGYFMLDGVVAIAVFALAAIALDRVVLPSVDNARELAGDNRAMGTVELFAYPAIGFILLASFAGNGSSSYGEGLLSALLFSSLGVAVLLIAYWLYDQYQHRQNSDIDEAILGRQVSSALEVGSAIAALGIALSFSIAGDFTGWGDDVRSFALAVPFVLAGLLMASVLGRFLVPSGNRAMACAGVRASTLVMTGLVTGLAIV